VWSFLETFVRFRYHEMGVRKMLGIVVAEAHMKIVAVLIAVERVVSRKRGMDTEMECWL
jgi:hypothetical protein